MFKTWKLLILTALLGITAAAVAACGGEAEPAVITEVQTVIVEKQVPGEAVVQTVIVEKEVTRTEKVIETVIVERTTKLGRDRKSSGDGGRREGGPRQDCRANRGRREGRDTGPGA